jgi:O-antigen/teichoic acid export membrane protein
VTTEIADGEHDVLATPAAGPTAIRGGALRTAGYLVGAGATALSAAVLFRHLGVVDTGRYVLVLSIVAVVTGLSDLGITAVAIREFATLPRREQAAFTRSMLGLRLVLTAVGVVLMFAFTLIAGYPSVVLGGVALGAVALVLQSVQSSYASALQAFLRFGSVAALDLARQLITVVLTLALVAAGASLLSFLAIPIAAGVVVLVATAVLVRGTVPLRPSIDIAGWQRLIRRILPYALAIIATSLYFRIAVIAVSLLASATELGYFNAAFRVIEVLIGIPGLVVGAAFPIFARAALKDRARLGYALGRVFDATALVGAWTALVVTVGAPVAIAVIGGAEFAPASTVLAIEGVAVGCSFIGTVWSYTLLSLSRQGDILRTNLIALGLGLVATPLLAALDGARGAAISVSAIEIVLVVVGAVFVRSHDPALFPSLRIVPKIALAVALAALPRILGLDALPATFAATAIYWSIVVVARAVPVELVEAWRSKTSSRVG